MGKGQTFLSETQATPTGNMTRHLNVVVSEQDEEGCYLVIPVTTYHPEQNNQKSEQNTSCVLEAGEHSFIKHKSWAKISKSRSLSYIEIFNGLKRGLLIQKSDIASDVLARIQESVKTSIFLPGNLKHFRECL